MGTRLFRTLVFYLVVRALCAPVALRTQAVGPALGEGFVFRVCTWPVLKQHLASAELTQDLDDSDRPALDWSVLPQRGAFLPTPVATPGFDRPRSPGDPARDRSLARLRC